MDSKSSVVSVPLLNCALEIKILELHDTQAKYFLMLSYRRFIAGFGMGLSLVLECALRLKSSSPKIELSITSPD